MKKVACVGILVADTIVEPVKKYPNKGELLNINSITVHNGGNAMTASINIKKLGVETLIVGMVGNDMYGDFLEKRLKESNVNTSALVKTDKAQTSASIAIIDDKGERSFLHCKGSNAVFSEKDIDYSLIEKYDIVFVTGTFLLSAFDGEGTMQFLKKCKEMGKTTLLDVCWDDSGSWDKLIDMCMPYIDFFMPSIEEAENIAKEEDPEKIADVFMKKGVKNVIIKLGSKGSFLKCENEEKGTFFPSFKVEKPVDTTGAGDSFCSGFIASLAKGNSPKESMIIGNATGAMSVMAKGATTGVKSYDETLKFIEKQK